MADGDDHGRGVVLTEEQKKRLRARNLALALALAALVVLFWLVTVFKMGGDVANRAL
jgi:4-amino-4-deoxy-L-arabinose transferase-like glycosyltransferase